MTSIADVLKYIATNEIRWIDLHFFDVDGNANRISVSNKQIDEETFSKGVYAGDLTNLFGLDEQGELSLLPDPDTIARVPWETSTVRLLCDVVTATKNERYLKDSRYVADRVQTNLSALGVKKSKIGTSCEFYIFDGASIDRVAPQRGASHLIESREGTWNPNMLSHRQNGSFLSQPTDTLYTGRVQIAETLDDNFGYVVTSHSHGRSRTGQQHMNIKEYELKTAADAFNTLKFVAKNLSSTINSATSFMPYPVKGEFGSLLYIHQSFWKTSDNNIFYDGTDKYAQISQTARYYIGGLLEHATALSLFTSPSVNSYRKLASDPKVVGWSTTRRDAVAFVPHNRKNFKDATRVVYTAADPSVNSYLAYGAVVAAGIDGIKNKIDHGDPIEEEGKKSRKEVDLPGSLYEAAESLGSDNKFIKGVVPAELLDKYLDTKLEEHKKSMTSISSYEFERYFDV